MTRPFEEFETVLVMVADGRNDCEISRRTGIPRRTVRDWRLGKRRNVHRPRPDRTRECDPVRCEVSHDFDRLPVEEYCYLLGMYLGDGCISSNPRGAWRLRVICDDKYPGILLDTARAMQVIRPHRTVCFFQRRGCTEVSMASWHWPCFFPQHGPGRKHERPISLAPWQELLVERGTESFVRGMIHSDGCRVVANDRGIKSVRYHFSNLSEDIKSLYCAALDRLDIPWTRPSYKDIAVYPKAATARLDEFIGPKY